jgi:nucleotide-binding universal stress UspA family protein
MRIQKVLFATDFSEHAEKALAHALWYAREFGAELHMLHALVLHDADPANPDLDFPDLEEAGGQIREWARSRMREVSDRIGEPEVPVVRATRRGIAAAPAILEYGREEDVDLVVMATHGRRGIRRLLMGSVAEEVVRTAARPVLTVRPDSAAEHGDPPRRILVPVDFSTHSDRALRYGAALCERTGAELHAVHAVSERYFPDAYFAEAAEIQAMAAAAEERVPEALHRNVHEVLGEEADVRTRIEAGSPAQAVAEYAEEEDVDLVVVSSHGRTGLERVLLGSVAEGVIRRAPCPVLTVKAFGKDLLSP